jgi:hypothetical protein
MLTQPTTASFPQIKGLRFAAGYVFNGIAAAGGLTRHPVVIDLVNGRSPSDNFEWCSKVKVVLSKVNVVLSKVKVVLSKVNVVLSKVNVVLSKVNVVLSLLRMVISVLDLVVVVEKCPRLNVVLSLLRMVIRVLDVVLGNRSARSFRLWG